MPQLSPSLQQRLLELHLTVVAEHRAEVVGLAHLAEVAGEPPELALLVEDAWQRRGVGRALAEAVLRSAEDDGHSAMVACTLPSSTARPLAAAPPARRSARAGVHALGRRARAGDAALAPRRTAAAPRRRTACRAAARAQRVTAPPASCRSRRRCRTARPAPPSRARSRRATTAASSRRRRTAPSPTRGARVGLPPRRCAPASRTTTR